MRSDEHHECHRKSCKCSFHRINLPTFCDTGPELAACPVQNGCGGVRRRSLPDRTSMFAIVGRTPWSARVPLDPPVRVTAEPHQADEGVACGPGGPPHHPELNMTATVANW